MLANKLNVFQALTYSLSPSLFAITQSWLSDSIVNREILPCDYEIFRKDCGSRGGGVLLAVHHALSVSLIPSPSYLEVVSLQIHLSTPLCVCVMYVSPSSPSQYFNSIIDHLEYLFSNFGSVLVLGTLNSRHCLANSFSQF